MPEGGAKDETPPKVTSERPPNGTVNFNQRRIVISFDEYIELSNAFQEVHITPTTEKSPVLTLSGKSLYMDTAGLRLQPNTTYTIQFGNAIKDINEGNVLAGYQYVFSTGPYIDSLFVEGNVASADEAVKPEKVRVQLYTVNNDTGLYKGRPAYMALADESGHFRISNLPKGKFRLYALEDKNDNYVLDIGERVGYVPGVISLDSGLTFPDPIIIFPPKAQALKVPTIVSSQSDLKVKVNMPIDTIKILGPGAEPIIGYPFLNPAHDSLVYWYKEVLPAGTEIRVPVTSAQYKTEAAAKAVVNTKDTSHIINMTMDMAGDNLVQFGSPLILRFQEPVDRIDYKKIYFTKEDSTDLPGIQFRFMDSSHTNLAASYSFQDGDKYRIAFGKGAFTTIRGRVQDTTSGLFAAPSRRDFGLLEINVTTGDAGELYLFELMNPSGNSIYSKKVLGSATINLPYVQPGAYKLRLVHDINRNGRWDTGDLSRGTQPEPIYYYTKDITARANWELAGIIFDISSWPKR